MSFLEFNQFGDRLAELRIEYGISARDLSLSIGQNEHYINQIENHYFYPSMQAFIYICEYLNITPCHFFNIEINSPYEIDIIIQQISEMSPDSRKLIKLLSLCLE
ncbi:MAG: helix-turn-helix transcriptional regulator [Eubacterium sp.]|nr:helix-turn-helix transcriptional regulator [Eubacterium sp.]